jgi:C4-dicarboxylate-specific signal transduction histidine kinase
MNVEHAENERRRQGDLSFFGRIMANVSHEFNNVLTVISELSGLLQDLSMLAERGKPIQPEKLKKITENISRHIARGKEMIANMNQFSHSVDEPLMQVNIRSVAANMQILTERIVQRRQAILSLPEKAQDVQIIADPFALRRAIFTCLELAMGASSTAPSFALAVEHDPNGARINLSSDAKDDLRSNEKLWSELEQIAQEIGGSVCGEQTNTGFSITISLRTKSGLGE